MEAGLHLSSSSSSSLVGRPLNGVVGKSTVISSSPSLGKTPLSVSVLPTIRCRLTRSHTYRYTYPGYSYSTRKAGTASNVEVEAAAVPTSVPVRVAYELLLARHRFLDVRTPEEFSAGCVPGAINIPYMFKVGSGMAVNPNFLAQVSSQFGKDDELLIGCQSGKRSLLAASVLQSAGYTGIVDVAGGFIAWTQSELPTEM